MILTETAKNLILNIMKKQNLNPQKYSFFLSKAGESEADLAISFVKKNEEFGYQNDYGELNVILAYNLDVSNLKIDTQEMDNDKYLTFQEGE